MSEESLIGLLLLIPIFFIAGIIMLFNPKTQKVGGYIVLVIVILIIIGFQICMNG